MREVILTFLTLILTMALLLVLYDRATTPSCALAELSVPNIPQDWMVQPPNMHVRP